LIAAIRGRLSSPLLLVATGGWIVGLVAVALVREAIRLNSVNVAASAASLAAAHPAHGARRAASTAALVG
jgi:hypothetical protein